MQDENNERAIEGEARAAGDASPKGERAIEGYRVVGQLVIDDCCAFRVWQRGAQTSVEVGVGCASCVSKLREALPDPPPSSGELPA